jgi:hypothetical protein
VAVFQNLTFSFSETFHMDKNTEFERSRAGSMAFGGLVYVGVVLAATTLFVSFVLTAFPEDAYFSRFVMGGAGLLIGASMLAFPMALHNWAIGGMHRTVTMGLYYGEMAIVAANTLVAFTSLLGKYAGYEVPAWVSWYEPFTIVSIVYTLVAWGTVFLLDPTAQAKARELQAERDFRARVAAKKLEFLESIEGEEAVLAVAQMDIEKQFGKQRPTGEARHFGNNRTPGVVRVQPLAQEREPLPLQVPNPNGHK